MTAVDSSRAADPVDTYGPEAMGAFAHELRTPLTAIMMVLEVARGLGGGDGELVLDAELAEMVQSAVGNLQKLADDLQDTSRLMRGRTVVGAGPAMLSETLAEAARETGLRFVPAPVPVCELPVDAARLTRLFCDFAETTNRSGDSSGTVRVGVRPGPRWVEVEFESGEAGGEPRAVSADLGYPFFRAATVLAAMGGTFRCLRGERFLRLCAVLPLQR